MSRDYKHSQRTRETRSESNKSWLWLVAGLILGGASSGLIMSKTQPSVADNPDPTSDAIATGTDTPADSNTATADGNEDGNEDAGESTALATSNLASAQDCTPVEQPAAPDEYTFYRLLPEMEIPVIEGRYNQPEVTTTAAAVPDPQEPAAPIEQPGSYLLQVASLRSEQDANSLVAKLALLGVSAHIQKITIDDEIPWHRVRVGPIDLLEDVNYTREQLREAGYASLPLRIRE